MPVGQHKLGLSGGRDGLFYIPSSLDRSKPAPLVVLLHGAGGKGADIAPLLIPLADQWGFIILAPESRQSTWDVIAGGWGPDVSFIDRALNHIFKGIEIDPRAMAIGGFSDGASYALSLGLTNGDIFDFIMAFSPGFSAAEELNGRPEIFVSHGESDNVLRIDSTSRRLVPRLRSLDLEITYREFQGGHTVPWEFVTEAVDLWLSKQPADR